MKAIARFEKVSEGRYAQDVALFSNPLPLETLPLPRRATQGSAGYDLASPVRVTLLPGQQVMIPTGMRVLMQPGWVLMIYPRSSLGRKYGLRLANTTGVIDADYAQTENEGHILVPIVNGGTETVTLEAGERFCQGVLLPFGLAEEETPTQKRQGGFGSTGNK